MSSVRIHVKIERAEHSHKNARAIERAVRGQYLSSHDRRLLKDSAALYHHIQRTVDGDA